MSCLLFFRLGNDILVILETAVRLFKQSKTVNTSREETDGKEREQ